MVAHGMISLKKIWEILEICAKGYQKQPKTHHWRVTFDGKTYSTLPLGKHEARKDVSTDIERYHVKKMARMLGIYDCVIKRM